MPQLPEGNTKPLPPTREVMRHFETNAMQIREQAGFGCTEPIDSVVSAEAFGVKLHIAENEDDASVWSGSGQPLPNGKLFVMLNANQTQERMNVTLLEEVAHRHYGHDPVVLSSDGRHSYDAAQEQEAYWTAAAVLFPMVVVAKAVRRGETAAELGKRYGASEELAEMRISTLGLWDYYKTYALEDVAA